MAVSGAVVNVGKNIVLTSNLSLANNVTIHGNGYTFSAFGIAISGGATVAMDHLLLTGVDNQVGDGNYGVMVQGASTLNASYITMTLNTAGENNVGFNVDSGSTLNLSNSTLTWGAGVVGEQQYGVYAQSGAVAVVLDSNSFTFSATNTSGAYSYLIGMQGDAVANYPALTLTSNTNTSYMKLLLVGADSVVNKQTWAATTHSYVSSVAGDNKVGIIDGINDGIYTYLNPSWILGS